MGQASRPAIRRAQLRAEARTHFGRLKGRRAERRNAKFTPCRDYDAVDKENGRLTEGGKIPPFGPVSRCVGRVGAGRHPRAHKNPLTALVEAVWRKAGTAARTRFHPKTESEPTGWKYSRRKPWRFYSAWAVTSARGAGGFRGRRLTLFRRERDLVDADFWKRTGKASSWGIFCDAYFGFRPFSRG